jgi:16S rRNA (guanine527-N7)-methyltransferase
VDRPREPLPTRVEDTQPLPPAYDAALEAGLRALGLTLDPASRAAIDGHARLLLAWTTAINLTAIREPGALALGHVVDSLSALSILRDRGIDRFIDLGSGGGYPGMPIAVALPAARALLLEPVAKKAAFLSAAVNATGLDATVEAAAVRAEALALDRRHRGRWPAVTARAVSSLGDLVELAFPLLAPGGILVAWKRGALAGALAAELAAGRRAIDALGGGSVEVHDVSVAGLDGHRLIVATAHGTAPATFPRDPGTRKRRPW